MRITFQQQVLAGIALSILLVIGVGLTSYNALILQQQNAALVSHTRDVIRSSSSVKNLLLTAESNIRGMALTKNTTFENSYKLAAENIWIEVDLLKKSVSDNPAQVVRLDTLNLLLTNKLDLMNRQLDMINSNSYSLDSLRSFILLGKQLSSKIDFNFNRIENTEQALLTEREQMARESSSQAKMFIVFGTAIFILVIFVMFYFIRRTYDRLSPDYRNYETKIADQCLAYRRGDYP